ncbi:hypothetical protein J4G37_01555 [Microvirga sp. 3-52]|nr:hypothetical protein [Microvirga sp. 3-52]
MPNRKRTCFVITGLVPVISMKKSAALHRIGMAGTDPRIKSGDGHDVRRLSMEDRCPCPRKLREGANPRNL